MTYDEALRSFEQFVEARGDAMEDGASGDWIFCEVEEEFGAWVGTYAQDGTLRGGQMLSFGSIEDPYGVTWGAL